MASDGIGFRVVNAKKLRELERDAERWRGAFLSIRLGGVEVFGASLENTLLLQQYAGRGGFGSDLDVRLEGIR